MYGFGNLPSVCGSPRWY